LIGFKIMIISAIFYCSGKYFNLSGVLNKWINFIIPLCGSSINIQAEMWSKPRNFLWFKQLIFLYYFLERHMFNVDIFFVIIYIQFFPILIKWFTKLKNTLQMAWKLTLSWLLLAQLPSTLLTGRALIIGPSSFWMLSKENSQSSFQLGKVAIFWFLNSWVHLFNLI